MYKRQRLIRSLIKADAAVGDVLPRIVLMLARALDELPRVPDDLVGEMAGRLLQALATQGTPRGIAPLRDEIDDALTRLRKQRPQVVNEAIVKALGQAPSAPITADLIRRREWWEQPFAEPLHTGLLRGMDSNALGWPILMALRDYATPALPPAAPRRPMPPASPKILGEYLALEAQREAVSSGDRLRQVVGQINALIETLPEAVAADPAASDPANPESPARRLRQLHEARTRLESGEELRRLDEQIAALKPKHERAVEFHAQLEREHEAQLVEHEEAVAEYRKARLAEGPQGHWPTGLHPLRQWLRDDPRRMEDLRRNPVWLPLFIALYGGVKDYRVARYESAYEKAFEGFHEFLYTHENHQDEAILERARALDDFKPSPSRWRAALPFEFSPDFVFRHSPLHGELMARFDAGVSPNADGVLERLWSHPVPVVRVEAALAAFSAGGNLEPLIAAAWATSAPVKRETAASVLHALEGLLAGWQETLEHLLPRTLEKMLSRSAGLPAADADALREMLLAVSRKIADPKRRAVALWQLLPSVPAPLVAEVWEAASEATWAIADYLGYDEPNHECEVVLETCESPATSALGQRFSKETFNRMFAEALCPEWAEHPDLFGEALHAHFARTPPKFDDAFQDRLLRGKESLPDICAAWFSISSRYPFAVVLDTCGVRVPSSEDDFYSFAEAHIATLEAGRHARALLRLAKYLPLGLRQSPIDQARTLADAIADPVERLATYESILAAMPNGPEQMALADSAMALIDCHPPGRARTYSHLKLAAMASPDRLPGIRGRLLGDLEQVADVAERAAIIRQARRWASAEVQIELLRSAAIALPDERLRLWAVGRLSPDLPGFLHEVTAASADDHEEMLAWVLAGLASRGADLLTAFTQQQDADPWFLLPASEALAIDRLLLLGEKHGLALTGSAASAVGWMNASGRSDLLKLFLPLLERPNREVWSNIYRWLDDPNPLVAQHAALLIAEHGRQITPRTFPHLLALLECGLDRSRLRAALTLHGRVVDSANEQRTLLASRLGGETLELIGQAIQDRLPDRLASEILSPDLAAGRQRSSEKVLSWMRHQIVFDSPQSMRDCLARLSTDPAARSTLSLVEACSSGVLAMFADRLLDEPSPLAQRAMLGALARLRHVDADYRMRPEVEDWHELTVKIAEWMARLSPQLRREPVLLSDANGLISSFVAATRSSRAAGSSDEIGQIVHDCRDVYRPLGETAAEEAMGLVDVLGEQSYYHTTRAAAAAHAAAERLVTEPTVVPPLLSWLAILLREDLNDPPFARVRQALLETVAVLAERHPSTVAADAMKLNLLPLLCRVVTFSSHFRSRADAVLLIGALRHATREAVIAILSALCDVFEVQNAALVAIDRFRHVDQDALDLVLAELDPGKDSATAIHGAARLLAGLAASECLTPAQRQAVSHRLATVLQDPGICRRGVYLMTGSGGKDEKGLRVRQEARLGEVLYEALLRVAGGTIQMRSPIKLR